ncbi:sulfotransferase domain-containing protein [Cesiribacter andamanensis]|nr:sulfotransferase domain-containing protein [Cesiribacter andamanensis]
MNTIKRSGRFLPFFRHRAYTPFLLLSYSRSGSTWVHTALNSHPHILSLGEELGPYFSREGGLNFLTYIFKRPHSKQVQALGSKLFYQQVYTDTGIAFWNFWREQQWPVIHLQRHNLLRIIVSEEIAKANKRWSMSNGKYRQDTKSKAIELLPEVLLQRMGHIEHLQQVFARQLKDYPAVLSISYEALQATPEEEFARIQKFLGVRPQALYSLLKKQNPEPLSQLLLNYAEIQQELQGSAWEGFLE